MWLRSKSRVNSGSYVWRIQSFSMQKFTNYPYENSSVSETRTVQALRSPVFKLPLMVADGSLQQTKLCLWLTRDRPTALDDANNWLQLHLSESQSYPRGTPSADDNQRYICSAWIVGCRQKERVTDLTGTFSSSFYAPKFVLDKHLFNREMDLVCCDQLTIVCEVHTLTNDSIYVNSWLFDPAMPTVVHDTDDSLANDLKRMLDRKRGSDVTLVANDGQEFPAHMLILTSRSPVFAAMFQHDMKEKQKKTVSFDDLAPETVAGLLEFVYTDAVSNITALTPELLSVAHRYDIPRMMTLCEEAMVSQLDNENAAEYFYLADLYDADQLRLAAKKFAVKHLYEVKKTDGWKKLQNERPQLTEEVIDELTKLMRSLTANVC